MILAGLVISGLLLAAFLALVIGIRGTERHRSLCNPYGDGLAGVFARRVLGVYVRQIEGHDQDHEDRYGYGQGEEVMPGMPITPSGFGTRHCACGALAQEHSRKCLKCGFRARWRRRKSRKDK